MPRDKNVTDITIGWKKAERAERFCGESNVRPGYISLWIMEDPAQDDNVFHVGEKLDLAVLALDKRYFIEKDGEEIENPTYNERLPVGHTDVFVFAPDKSVEISRTDEDGKVKFTPKMVGKHAYSVPEFNLAGMFDVVPESDTDATLD